MKLLLTPIALACLSIAAHAQTTATGTVQWWLKPVGGADVGPYSTQTNCATAAKAKNLTGDWLCEWRLKTTRVEPCPAAPAPATRTQACPSGTTGSGWPQTALPVIAPKPQCWAPGTNWLPTSPTAAQCAPIPTKPADLARTAQCTPPQVGSWSQTATFTLSGSTWVQGPWTPTQPAGACTTPPTGATVTNWVTIANAQHPAFTHNGVVRYGHPSKPNNWVSKTFNGPGNCGGQDFGNVDPAPGLYKDCQIQLSAPNVVQTGGMPVINVPLLPPPQKGFSTDKVISGGGFDRGPFDIGAFRTNCGVSHFAFDDPIVFPGQPGKSHLHMFFGNTGANGNSTPESIANSGDSTCSGGTANRTAYWIPAMVDLKTGAPVVPQGSIWYYKSAYYGVKAEDVKVFPVGLRFIAGDASRKTPGFEVVRIHCGNGSGMGNAIPNCPVGDTVEIGIQFPQCWDGVNLDSPDHRSHMAYANNGCPATHPVALSEISLNVSYRVTEANPHLNWKLSSDNYVGTGGYSMHADWFNGWKKDIQETWVANCINKRASSSNAICDGRYLAD